MTARRKPRMSIQQAVKEIVSEDKKVLKLMSEPFFNTSAYARQIQKRVEKLVGTKVKLNTITVSLKRLQKKLAFEAGQAAQLGFEVLDLQVKAPVIVGEYQVNKTTRLFVSKYIADKYAQDKVYFVQVTSDKLTVAYARDVDSSFEKISEFRLTDKADYAFLKVKVHQKDVKSAMVDLAQRLEAEEIDVKVFSVGTEHIMFVVKYPDLIKVLAWFG